MKQNSPFNLHPSPFRILLILLLFLSSLPHTFCPDLSAQNVDQKLYRIYVDDFKKIRNLEKTGVNIYNLSQDNYIEIIATEKQAALLKDEGFKIEFIANNFIELSPYSRFKASPEYHDYQETNDFLTEIAATNPGITKLTKIGESVLQRDILCLKISDNAETDEDETPILICGAHHGNEVLGVEATLYQIEYLINNYGTDPEVTNWIDNYEIWFIPLVNPDGREAVRRYNENGVDLNRNYSFAHTPGGTHGDAGFSEPETRAIRDFTAEFPPVLSLSYHTSGRYFLYSWTHTDEAAPDSSAMIYMGNILAESVVFPEGNSTGHYTLRQGGRWYFTEGEYCDYLYAIHNALAFTVEMYTRQNPDGSVIQEVVQRNLEGFKTLMRQAQKAGVTGVITDKTTGLPIVAQIKFPEIDDQGKLSPHLTDEGFGRYYKYLAPGEYLMEVSSESYRDQLFNITIDPEQLMALDIQMESGPLITLGEVELIDHTTGSLYGNGDGLINLGELLGLRVDFTNVNTIEAKGAYVKASPNNGYVTFLQDSVFIGDIAGNSTQSSVDTLIFQVSSDCPDGEELEFYFMVHDSDGPGWRLLFTTEMYAPVFEVGEVSILDPEGDNDGIWDAGEKVTANIDLINVGRQDASSIMASFASLTSGFTVLTPALEVDNLSMDAGTTLMVDLQMDSEIDDIAIGKFSLNSTTAEGYLFEGSFQLSNIDGYYDDFENGENGWQHDSYRTTSNHHDDWMLGLPAGLAGDPDRVNSGSNCWGTDHGWELYMGDTWNGAYQSSVYNYLKSPVIDCSQMSGVGLSYMRWLTTATNDIGIIRVNDSIVWESSRRGHSDLEWTEHRIDISGIADGNPKVQVYFEMQSNNSNNLGGWNIDDFIIANGIFASSSIDKPETPAQLGVTAYPNPFSDKIKITYENPTNQHLNIQILDVSGRVIKTLINTMLAQGVYEYEWDGTSLENQSLPTGIYTCRIIAGHEVITKNLILNK